MIEQISSLHGGIQVSTSVVQGADLFFPIDCVVDQVEIEIYALIFGTPGVMVGVATILTGGTFNQAISTSIQTNVIVCVMLTSTKSGAGNDGNLTRGKVMGPGLNWQVERGTRWRYEVQNTGFNPLGCEATVLYHRRK